LTTAIKTSLSLSALTAVLIAACSGSGNTGQYAPSENLVKQIPWTNGAVPVGDGNGGLYTSALPAYPPIGQDLADPGSLPVDCDSATAPYELAPWIATMEPDQYGGAPGDMGLAIRWAGADDLTRGSWRSPGFTTWYPGLMTMGLPWGTPAQSVTDPGREDSRPFPPGPVPVCQGAPNANVLHMRGANFRYYGGNVAHILAGDNYADTNYCPPNSDLCPPVTPEGATIDSVGFPTAPTKNGDASGGWQLRALHTYWDVSKYEGVSFWARRGPDSMGTLLVTINDKYTSDDQNRQNETYCRRIFACHSKCQNYGECLPSLIEGDTTNAENPQPVMRCYDRAKGMPVGSTMAGDSSGMGSTDDLLDAIYPRCGNTCTFRKTYPDADLEGKECRPYTFTSGESAEYCFNENDPPPPSREERCGDGFTSMVQLTGDWKLYTVPFSEMRQGGYGKRAPEFDLKSAYSITLGWGSGNVDFYLDNISLYRTRKL
jgi:hypothetical protein